MKTTPLSNQATEARELKDRAVALTAQALASGTRLRLLSVLAQAEQTVDGLADKAEQSRANTSAQLKVLAAAGLVTSRRAGRNVFYRLASDHVRALLAALHATAMAQSAELRELLQSYYELPERLTRKRAKELVEQVRTGEVVLLDLRPADEFAYEHPEGAVNVPLEELQSRLDELPADREIFAYCRGRFCVMAVEGVEALRRAGRSAHNLGAASRELLSAGMRAAP